MVRLQIIFSTFLFLFIDVFIFFENCYRGRIRILQGRFSPAGFEMTAFLRNSKFSKFSYFCFILSGRETSCRLERLHPSGSCLFLSGRGLFPSGRALSGELYPSERLIPVEGLFPSRRYLFLLKTIIPVEENYSCGKEGKEK